MALLSVPGLSAPMYFLFPFQADSQQILGVQSAPLNPGNSFAAGALLFAVTALVFFLLGCLMLAGRPDFLLLETLTGHGQAWINLMAFGFILPAAFAAIYWALPRALGVQLFSDQFLYLHYCFHMAGFLVVMLVPFVPELPNAPMGRFCLGCGVALFVFNVGMSLRRMARPDAASAFLSTACVWLAATMLLGLPFGVAPLAILEPVNWRAGWFVLLTAGFVFNTIFGLALRMTPLTLGLPYHRTDASWYALAVINVGVAWSAAAVTFGPPRFVVLTAALLFVGAVIFLVDYQGLLRRCAARDLRWDTRLLRISLWLIPAAALLLALHALWQMDAAPVPPEDGMAAVLDAAAGPLPIAVSAKEWMVGLFAFFGVVAPGLVALLFQLQEVGRSARSEQTERGVADGGWTLWVSLGCYAAGVILFLGGMTAHEERLLVPGSILLAFASLGLLWSFLRNLRRLSVSVGPMAATAEA